jgi:hypothetical protein
MSSNEFKLLRANISQLTNHFLNFKKRDDGDYTDAERLNCRAFIAFSHAEFEHYLESLSLRIIDEAIQEWKNNKRVGIVGGAVLAFRRSDKIGIPNDPKQPGKENTLATIIMTAFVAQRGVVTRNNGIMPKNFSEIYTPLGVTDADVDEILLIQLSNSGKHRGAMVHDSSNVSLPKVRDPFGDEQKDVDSLLEELQKFDSTLSALRLYA